MPLFAILIAASVLVYREYNRRNKSRLLLRVIAVITVILCLSFLIFPISWLQKSANPEAEKETAILITSGYNPDSVKAFTYGKQDMPVYTSDDLYRLDPALSRIHIFGYGLSPGSSPLPENLSFILHAPPENGIVSADWNRKLSAGELLKVQGRYINKSKEPVIIYLQGFDTMLDSVKINSSITEQFELTTIPRFKAKSILRLLAVQNRDTIEINPVPVTVTEAQKPSILFLSSSPDFEQKFFQQWLADQGYGLVARNRTSKDKTEKKYFNAPGLNAERISSDLLKAVRLVISDAGEMNRLSQAEKQNITEAVSAGRIGLLIRTDSTFPESPLLRGRFSIKKTGRQLQSVVMKPYDRSDYISIPFDGQMNYINAGNGLRPVVTDSAGISLVSVYEYGAGKIALSTMPDLYSLILSGKKSGYADLWTAILNSLYSERDAGLDFRLYPAFPQVYHPINISVISPTDAAPDLHFGNS